MLRSYLKIAWRNLRKQPGFTAINVVGLATGLACCLLITLYVVDELSYDRFHQNADRIYRVNMDIKFGGDEMQLATSPDPLGPSLKRDFPQVEQFTRFYAVGARLVKRAGTATALREPRVIYADSTLFDVFTLPLLAGNPKQALMQPGTVVITESAGRRYFGSANPMGQTLLIADKPFRVTGLMRDLPTGSHFHADLFPSMNSSDYAFGNWLGCNLYTYVLFRPGTNVAAFTPQFERALERYVAPMAKQYIGVTMDQFQASGNRFRAWLMPLTDLHLHSKQTIEMEPPGDVQYVYVFSAVALFILLLACINFMNLSTARSAQRATEVGVRKVLGSARGQLVGQFLTESVLLTTVSLVLALALVWLGLPLFNNVAGKTLRIGALATPGWLGALVALPLVVGALAGSYPALFLSAFQPVRVLKSKLVSGQRGVSLRSGLVVVQFATSVLLICGTLVVYRQLTYIQEKNLGFNRAQVLTVQTNDAPQTETFKQEVLKLPGVQSGTVSSYLPVESDRADTPLFPEGEKDQKKAVSTQMWRVDYDYVKTLQMQITQGRDFSRRFGSDSSGVILNESAVKLFGFKNPIGQRIDLLRGENDRQTLTILGVVKDFNYESLRRNVGAVALMLAPSAGAISFRVARNTDLPALLGQMESRWKQMMPGQPLTYSFMDEDFDRMYRAEQRVGTLALTFAGLAVLIACLGLFGLATFMAQQRTKEIGVRKVLGASVTSIVTLLSRDFLRLVLVAILIAVPVAYYVMQHWLADFAYKVELEWWVFALAGMLAVGIALLTVSFQSIKAALMNPVKSLRSE